MIDQKCFFHKQRSITYEAMINYHQAFNKRESVTGTGKSGNRSFKKKRRRRKKKQQLSYCTDAFTPS